MKIKDREEAIRLRKKGYTYSEILKQVPVAKSTLSLWLRSVGLTEKQYQRITKKKLQSAKRGALARKRQRILVTKRIKDKAKAEIGKIGFERLKLIGAMLYWAEGSKEKEHRPSTGVVFSNSDPLMIALFIKWLKECLNVSKKDIYFELFVHETHTERLQEIITFWVQKTGFDRDNFDKIYFKKNIIRTNRKNIDKTYFGLLRVRVRKSVNLNRRISGLIEGVCLQCGMV